MSGGNSEASSVAALALAFHRSPTKHPELLRGSTPLPASLSILLRLAGGTPLNEVDPALATLAPENQLREAALFFVEHVLFQRDASHYRVLGLNQDATGEQIKEHHRLLMRLFHPDRESQADERREEFATRINLAYNTLRDADQRESYNTTLKPQTASVKQPSRQPPGVIRRRMPEPESFWTVRVHPVLMRYLPQWVLVGTALVSFLVVGVVYLFNPPVHVPQSTPVAVDETEKPGSTVIPVGSAVESATAEAGRLDEVVARFERRIAAAGRALSESVSAPEKVQHASSAEVPKKVEVTKTIPVPARVVAQTPVNPQKKSDTGQSAVAVTKPVVSDAAQATRPVTLPIVSVQPTPGTTQPAPTVVAVTQAAAATAPTPGVEAQPLPDPNSLLSRFLNAYERGDMQACMALLDEGLRADAGGKSELRREYDALFKGTDLRHVKILNINWSRDGEFIRGEGRYRATLMRKGETLLRTQDGQLRVEMVRRGSTALISELYYLGGRS